MTERKFAYSDLFNGKRPKLSDFRNESHAAQRALSTLVKEGTVVGQGCFDEQGKRDIVVWISEKEERDKPKSKEVLLGILVEFALRGD